jgi:hypothetical protein
MNFQVSKRWWISLPTERLIMWSRDSSVGIATGWKTGLRFPEGANYFLFSTCPNRVLSPFSFWSDGYLGHIPRGKTAVAWSWPLTFMYCRGKKRKQKTSGSVHPHPHTSSRRIAYLIEHRDKFTLSFAYVTNQRWVTLFRTAYATPSIR